MSCGSWAVNEPSPGLGFCIVYRLYQI